jgi:hypothetical protein
VDIRSRRTTGFLDFDFHRVADEAHLVCCDVLHGWVPGDTAGLDVEARPSSPP